MYCGDETGSFVGHIGAHTSQFGYGGQDAPVSVIPSYVALDGTPAFPTTCYSDRFAKRTVAAPLRGVECPSTQQPVFDPVSFLAQGDSIENWDAYEQLWQHSMEQLRVKDTLKHTKGGREVKPSPATSTSTTLRPAIAESSKVTHPVLAITPGITHAIHSTKASRHKERCKITEFFMETLDVGALFIAPAPMLIAFSHGRQTALVVDVSDTGTSVTPVVDGLLLRQAQRRSGRGWDWLGHSIWQALSNDRVVIRPRYHATPRAAVVNDSPWHAWAMRDVLYELRTSVYDDRWSKPNKSRVPFAKQPDTTNDSEEDDDEDQPMPDARHFELPDGTLVDLTTPVGRDIPRVNELLFSETLPFPVSTHTSAILQQHHTLSNAPLHRLMFDSLSAVADADVRKELSMASILVTSEAPASIAQRLAQERWSAHAKQKILTSKHRVEHSCAAWIGGSILSSLGNFQQLWMSKTEYEEYGAALAMTRFPE